MAIRVSELRNGAAKAATAAYAELDDRMLVLDFQGGNAEVFGEIHRRYAGLARHICQRILGNADDADEATQEAMLRVYQGLSRFNGRYALQPWVARIATNVSLDATRARTRRPQTGDSTVFDLREELRGYEDDPVEALERGLERERVNEVLASLPEHHREALVLREFEGRSHREIGERLGVTPSQAKALIHRAKGSFRRAWENGKDRRGLAVLAPILLAPLKVPQLFRRLMIPTQELAASATAAPAATTSVVTTGERVTAAAVAVLVAGSAAVGAVALKRPQPEPKPTAPPSVELTLPATKPEPPLAPVERRTKSEKRKAKVIPPVVVSPEGAPSPEASESPSPSPSGSPSPTPPPIPPAPPWSLTLESSVLGNADAFSLLSSRVIGTPGKAVVFSQAVTAQAQDAKGNPTWSLYAEYWGSAQPAAGTVDFWFFLDTAVGRYTYDAGGTLTSAGLNADGSFSYTFTGSYSLTSGPTVQEPVPHDGSVVLVLRFWQDGTTLYAVDLSLRES